MRHPPLSQVSSLRVPPNLYHFNVNSPDDNETPRAEGADEVQVSVVIPVFNDIDALLSCVDALATQKLPQDRFEVIVVDNGPESGAEARLVRVSNILSAIRNASALHEPRPGSYAARNLGLSIAKGRVLAFTDSDCAPAPDWLMAGLAFLEENQDAAAAAGPIRLFAKDPAVRTGAELYELRHGFQVQRYIATASFGATANLFARRTAFDLNGPFDASLRSGGDKEWGMRLKRNGGVLKYAPDAIVHHPARRSIDELRIKAKRVVGGDVVLRRRQGWSRLNWIRYSLQPLRPPLRTIWRARRDPIIRSRSELVRYGTAFILTRWTTALYRFKALRNWRSV
jgi:glycosyltransferase involved in cell wall biosynthesis